MAYTTINKPSNYFDTKLYTGNGSTQTVTGLNFKPDFTWIKARSAANGHTLWDSVRGVTKWIDSAFNYTEQTSVNGLTSFNSDGFSLGTLGDINGSGVSQVAWNWLGSGTTPVTNTQGSVNSTVSANTTSGFSVVKWVTSGTSGNNTIGHGLGVAPKVIFFKGTSISYSWDVFHKSISPNGAGRIVLNGTSGYDGTWNPFGAVAPTSTVFSNDLSFYGNGNTILAYCFAEVKGFSKFGSYVGNGSTDGAFVYTGFKPAYIMIKQSNASGEGWFILDNKRETINPLGTLLIANDAGADNTSQNPILDFTSNGFKLRRTWGGVNGSGSTYIYMAFAEQPLVGTNNVPCTAR
jgi:hypothetical protein